MRGNPSRRRPTSQPRGSIPARAGEPLWNKHQSTPHGVYPRACGGTYDCYCFLIGCQGLSPRVRGNRVENEVLNPCLGSIPARAGEPTHSSALLSWSRVYPRACGGTEPGLTSRYSERGLSPRVRGNLASYGKSDRMTGSIPARAGEHDLTALVLVSPGSIPARAGEPASEPSSRRPRWVYPRACGGTPHHHACIFNHAGLSPRVRGNP